MAAGSIVPVGMTRYSILGALEVLHHGELLVPGSPKQRALLIDLLTHHDSTISRDRLIDDLWPAGPPSTAPGVLQNYVSQLRKMYGADTIRTTGPGYEFVVGDHFFDVDEFERLAGCVRASQSAGDRQAVLANAGEALGLWRGDPLADVAFEPFAQATVIRLRELRGSLIELSLEAEVALGDHVGAVARLEAAASENPYRERLWWLLVIALYQSGRQADALRAYQRARAVLADDLGLEPSAELRDLERAVLDQRVDVAGLLDGPLRRATRRRARSQASLVGREAEWSAISAHLDDGAGRLLLLIGEPGIGKTRLVETTRAHVESVGGTALFGRAFEVERGRPYGFWADALRTVELPEVDRSQTAALASLLPEVADADSRIDLDDATRLYDAVVHVLQLLASRASVVVLVDDIQWLDEHSASLLHHAIRRVEDSDVTFVGSARGAELVDNTAMTRSIQALRRDERLQELRVGPLADATIAQLTAPIAPGVDVRRIAEASNGNPLLALEMARALARGDDPLSSRVDALIGDRLARLDERAAELVPWVAAFGRAVAPGILARLVERHPGDLFEPLGTLERHGLFVVTDDELYDFAHDLVREAAYKRLSTPRRAMLHARVGMVLASVPDADDSVAAEVARHADAGGDSTTCALACIRAAARCLRLLAYGDAEDFVALGRRHTPHLDPPDRVRAEFQLIHVLLHPGVHLHDPGELTRDLADLCADAQRLGLDAELSACLGLLARAYHWGWGDIPRARALMQRAVHLIETTRVADMEPLLESARCLAYLEIDMERTSRLFDELATLDDLAERSFQFQWGLGLVRAWAGDLTAARTALNRAIELATARSNHWVSFECTARLALLELEAGTLDAAAPLCAGLSALAGMLGDGSEGMYAAAIDAVLAVGRGAMGGDAALDRALSELARIDAHFLTPDLLGISAELDYRAGRLDGAARKAVRALATAEQADRPLEAARAHALLACVAAARGDETEAGEHLTANVSDDVGLPNHVKVLWAEAQRLFEARHENRGVDRWL
jgi:DNA-binding SARP family transcriptional activator